MGSCTALYLACREGHEAAVDSLLHHGADPTISDYAGWSPLLAASYNGHWAVVQRLVHSQINTMSWSHHDEGKRMGSIGLWWACSRGFVEVVRVFLEAGADPWMIGHDGVTPLQIAKAHGHHKCARVLEVRRLHYVDGSSSS